MENQTSTAPCLPFQAPCDYTGDLGICCQGYCFQSSSDHGTGFCTEKNCLNNGVRCHSSGTMGHCCSSYCDHFFPEPDGVCMDYNSTERRVPVVWEPLEPPAPNPGQEINPFLIYGLLGAFFALVIIGGAAWCLRTRLRRSGRVKLPKSGFEVSNFLEAPQEPARILPLWTYTELRRIIDSTPYNANYDIPEHDFQIDNAAPPLGTGEFSVVFRATVKGAPVAAKMVRPGERDSEYLRALLRELKILTDVGAHENVVCLVGASTTRLRLGCVYVFTELCRHGSLEAYIREHRETFLPHGAFTNPGYVALSPPTGREPDQLVLVHLRNWCADIAAGMAHLSALGIVHGDLATRNVLLNEEMVAKISDFGLSRKLYTYRKYVKQNREVPMPWQHMAPEALDQFTFSAQSDVWSFGVTMWEIFSLGEVPYAGVRGYGPDFLDGLTARGVRLPKPEHAPEREYEIMQRCWALEPEERPTFAELFIK